MSTEILLANLLSLVPKRLANDLARLIDVRIKELTNKRVIEELEKQLENYFNQEVETYLSDNLKNRIKELKQE